MFYFSEGWNKKYNKRLITLNILQNIPLSLNIFSPGFLLLFEAFLKVLHCGHLYKGSRIKSVMNATAKCHEMKRQSCRNMTLCPPWPCSPNLSLCNGWLFYKVRMIMNWVRTPGKTTAQLMTLMKDFQNCFIKWPEWWGKCIWSKEEYLDEN